MLSETEPKSSEISSELSSSLSSTITDLSETASINSESSAELSFSSFPALTNLPDQNEQIHFRTVAGYGRGVKKPVKSGAYILGVSEKEQEYLQQQIQDEAKKKGYEKCRPIVKVSSPDKNGIPKSGYSPNGSKFPRKCKQGNAVIFEETDSPIKSILKQQVIASVKNIPKLTAPNTNIKSVKTVLSAKSLAEVRSQAEANKKQHGKRRIISQNQVMHNMSAKDIVKGLGFDDKQAEGWEWLHLIAHCFVGDVAQVPENLVVGTRECNTQMMIIENMISALVEKGHEVEVTSTAELVEIVTEGKITHLAKKIHLTVAVPTIGFSETYTFKPCKRLPPEERDGLYLKVAVSHEYQQCKKRTAAKSLITEFAHIASEGNKENDTNIANTEGSKDASCTSDSDFRSFLVNGTASRGGEEISSIAADSGALAGSTDLLASIDGISSTGVKSNSDGSNPLSASFILPVEITKSDAGSIGEAIAHAEGLPPRETKSPIYASFFPDSSTKDTEGGSSDTLSKCLDKHFSSTSP